MENQHRKITGYRELNQTEIDLMNKVKALGPQIEEVILEINQHLSDQYKATFLKDQEGAELEPYKRDQELLDRLEAATPERFVELAKNELQTGLMYLTRAVAQPTFF